MNSKAEWGMNHIPRQKTVFEETVWEEGRRTVGAQEGPDKDNEKD